jgi:SAM-dependent methyltransferase
VDLTAHDVRLTTTLLPRWRLPFAARSTERELLDGAVLDADDLAVNLRELALLNRLPGGTAASIAAIDRLAAGRRDLTILDVGTGGGDMALAMARHGRRGTGAGRWQVTAVESHPDVLALAARRLGEETDVDLVRGDALKLLLAEASVDVAHASLLLHHLDPDEAVLALREMRRVARLGVVINDLRRGILAYAMTAATVAALCRGRYTRADGLVSARRAYTLRELDALLIDAGLRIRGRSVAAMPRVVTVAVPVS